MDEARTRLTQCFTAVFPDLQADEVPTATPMSVPAWDSIANVTLLAIIEEEFELTIDPEALEDLTSFEAVLDYLGRSGATKLRVPGA